MTCAEKEIDELMLLVNSFFFEKDETKVIDDIRTKLSNVKKMVDDTYNIVDLWYQGGCEFPFEIDMNIDGEERTIKFDNIRQMLFEIRLLK